MANMFSGNQEKKIPKSFKDCYKTDSITKNLWLWCERLEKWGLILFWILIVIGVIDTITAGINAHQLIEEIGAKTVEEIREASAEMGIEIPTVFEALVNNLFSWTLYSFLEYCAYHILALLVGSLATIVQHTKITANITLYNSAKSEGITDDYEENNAEDNDEKLKKQKVKKAKLSEETKEDYDSFEKIVFCKHCGANISSDVLKCHVCGTTIPEPELEDTQEKKKFSLTPIDKPQKFSLDLDKVLNDLKNLSSETLYQQSLDDYSYTEEYRYLCQEELKNRNQVL